MFFKMRFLTIGVHLKFSVYITNPYFGFGEFGGSGGGAVMRQLVIKDNKNKTYSFIYFH